MPLYITIAAINSIFFNPELVTNIIAALKTFFKVFLIALITVITVERPIYSADNILRMATTTSTDNTGIIDYLAPYIESDTGIKLQWIAVGTGKALALGENCDVDIVLVHAPEAEKQFVENGFGINRHHIMYNDFVIIGPGYDPAGINGKPLSAALEEIVSKQALFVSRGDNSGTHIREISLWRAAGQTVPDKESWYIQTGQGMLATLNIAAEQGAYTLTDRASFIKYESIYKGKPPLNILLEDRSSLHNQYSIIAVNPDRCNKVRYDLADTLINWIILPRAQKLIGNYTLMGNHLFFPNSQEK